MRYTLPALICICLVAIPASVIAKGGPAPKVDNCHWDDDSQTFFVININSNALGGHSNHVNSEGTADHAPGEFFLDADGDGFGAGAADDCQQLGYVAVDGDCDHAAAAINPDPEEACGDDIDNNCSGEVDEECDTCPCFTTADVDAAWAAWQAQSWDYSYSYCYDVLESYYYYDYVEVYFYGQAYSADTQEYDYNDFYSIDYDYYYDQPYCVSYEYDYSYDYSTGEYDSYNYDYYWQWVTDAEHDGCKDLLRNWAEDNGMTCYVYY